MCDLNPKLCNRPRKKLPTSELKGAANHVGGYEMSRGRWRNQFGSTLTVPDLTFKQYTVLARVPFQPSNNLEKLAVAQDTDCSQWKMPCKDVVRWLNRAQFDPKRKPAQRPKTAFLPVTGVEADLVLTGIEGSKVKRILTDIGASGQKKIPLSLNRKQHFTEEWKEKIQENTPADMAVKALSSHILSTGKAELRSCFKDRLFSNQEPLLSLIKHPFCKIDNIGEIPQEFTKPISIAILDTWFDKEHCELKDNVELLSVPVGAGSNRSKPDECGAEMTILPNLADDHGTHVVGLIASAPNEWGIVGLNPYAKVKYITVDLRQLVSPPYRLALSNQVMLAARPTPLGGKEIRVANISWEYSNQLGGNDVIALSINYVKQSTLFVVAAGNDGESREQICGALPACLSDSENVITVVGLDRNQNQPNLWREGSKGSNWSQKFNIGAIAENVLSTTYKNYTGHFSGTSQAAPQVTAAASLLYSVYETNHRIDTPLLLPVRVKNRLIYTSDLFSGLLDKMEGGRLNVERAVDVARDFIVIKKNGERKEYAGKIVRFGNDARDEHILCECRDQSEPMRIERQDLRRMFYDEHRRKYIIFKNSIPGNPDSPLERITDCHLTTRSHIASVEPADGPVVEFQFRDIRDYISAMF